MGIELYFYFHERCLCHIWLSEKSIKHIKWDNKICGYIYIYVYVSVSGKILWSSEMVSGFLWLMLL